MAGSPSLRVQGSLNADAGAAVGDMRAILVRFVRTNARTRKGYFFFGRDSIGITRLSVFLCRRSVFTCMRRFFDALVRGLPFMIIGSCGECGVPFLNAEWFFTN